MVNSMQNQQIPARVRALRNWVGLQMGSQSWELTFLAGDASFRRYFRVHQGQRSFVVMDAPPEKESCQAFVEVAQMLRALKLRAPDIVAQDMRNGFLLISDFGDTTYLQVLNNGSADTLYQKAFDVLDILQQSVIPSNLPALLPARVICRY